MAGEVDRRREARDADKAVRAFPSIRWMTEGRSKQRTGRVRKPAGLFSFALLLSFRPVQASGCCAADRDKWKGAGCLCRLLSCSKNAGGFGVSVDTSTQKTKTRQKGILEIRRMPFAASIHCASVRAADPWYGKCPLSPIMDGPVFAS